VSVWIWFYTYEWPSEGDKAYKTREACEAAACDNNDEEWRRYITVLELEVVA